MYNKPTPKTHLFRVGLPAAPIVLSLLLGLLLHRLPGLGLLLGLLLPVLVLRLEFGAFVVKAASLHRELDGHVLRLSGRITLVATVFKVVLRDVLRNVRIVGSQDTGLFLLEFSVGELKLPGTRFLKENKREGGGEVGC